MLKSTRAFDDAIVVEFDARAVELLVAESIRSQGKADQTRRQYTSLLRRLLLYLPSPFTPSHLEKARDHFDRQRATAQMQSAYNSWRLAALPLGVEMPPWPGEQRKPRRLPGAVKGPVTLPPAVVDALSVVVRGTVVLAPDVLPGLTRKDVGFMPNRTAVVQIRGAVSSITSTVLDALCVIARWADGRDAVDWRAYEQRRPTCPLVPRNTHSDLALSESSIKNALLVTRSAASAEEHAERNAKYNTKQRARLGAQREKLVEAVKLRQKALDEFDALFAGVLNPSATTSGNAEGAAGPAAEEDELAAP